LSDGFDGVGAADQLKAWQDRATDTRPVVQTGWPGLDNMLHRRGFSPGTFVVLAGRPHTRKTAVMLNWVRNLLEVDVPVGLATLDEPLPTYVGKLASVVSRRPQQYLEEHWDHRATKRAIEEYRRLAARLSMTKGRRPDLDDLSAWLEVAEYECEERPRIVFLDYSNLLFRDRYAGKDGSRIPRLMEDLVVWTREEDVVTVVLHHVGKEEGGDGSIPLSSESLMWGGEGPADVILTTYRLALNRLGNMSRDAAESKLGDRFDAEKWADAVQRVERHRDSTHLQLVKNRPGVHLELEGIRLKSHGLSQFMQPADRDTDDPTTEFGDEQTEYEEAMA
jgi:hypothetical protein